MKRVLVVALFYSTFLYGYKICLDPGHGGSDPGATGSYYTEKQANLDVANWAKHFISMNSNTSQVLMTRTSDVNVSLQDRVNYANSNAVDRFISIHQNAYDGTVQGTETYCYTYGANSSFNLRDSTHTYLWKAYYYNNRGVKTADYYVLRYTEAPAILGEGSFIDYNGSYNESWRYAYNWRAHSERQGLAYAQGLCGHLGLAKPTFVLFAQYPETTVTAGVTFQVRDSFYISSYHAPCDLIFEVKRVSDGQVIYTQRLNSQSAGLHVNNFSVSLPNSTSDYQVYFLSYVVPQGGNWNNRITYVSTNLLPITVRVVATQDTSYVIHTNYPQEVYANTNFTVRDSFYIAPSQSPADLVFEIKSRASGTVLYSERVSNLSSGYWIKTFGLNPTISLPDSGYDYQVYFLSVLCPPGGGWSNRYTYASTYSNPTWVRTNPTQDTVSHVTFVSFPSEVYADSQSQVVVSYHLTSNHAPCDLVFEVRHYPDYNLLQSLRSSNLQAGDGQLNFNFSLADSLRDYRVYFRVYLTTPGGGWSSRFAQDSTYANPTWVYTDSSTIWYAYYPSEVRAESTFQVVDSFYISRLHAPCDIVFEVKSRSSGTTLYQERITQVPRGLGGHTFTTSVADSGYDYRIHFLSTVTPPGGGWSNRYTYVSSYTNPTWVRTNPVPDTSYVIHTYYPQEVFADSHFTVRDSFYISSSQSPADLVFEIKSRASGTVLYSERVSNLSSGYWIKTFGLNPTISLPDSGYDYQVYFLSVLCPPGGGWSNRYTFASTYSNPTWVRTNTTQDTTCRITFVQFPEELRAGDRVTVQTNAHLTVNRIPCDQVFEMVRLGSDSIIYSGRITHNSAGDFDVFWGANGEIVAPELYESYYVYFRSFLTPVGGGMNEAFTIATTSPTYTYVTSSVSEGKTVRISGDKGVLLNVEVQDLEGEFSFEIYDPSGRLLLRSADKMATPRIIRISRSLFPSSGIYFYILRVGGKTTTGKIVVF